jgi:AcrR family transcriptional regulator
VAERAGVRLPSLYKHVASLDALRQGVAALATRELADAMTAAAFGRAGSDALHAVAGAYRDYGRAHPGRYAAADAVLRVVFAVLAGYGITGDDAIDAAGALRAALHGFLALEAGGGFGMPRDIDRSYQRFITAFDTILGTWAAQPDPPAGDPGTSKRQRPPAA